MQRRITLAVLATLLATAQVAAAADCKKLLKESYWSNVRVEQVVRCLEEGLDPNTKVKVAKWLYYPLLKVAIADSSPEVVKALIAGGADIGYRDSSGKSLLNYAVTIGRFSKVEILLDAGVEFDDRNPMPFLLPAEAMKLLLDAGWNPNRRASWDGETTLYNVARFGEPEALRLLLDYGADPTIPDHKGRTPFRRSKGENRRILADALGIDLTKPKTKSGFGALAAGVLGAVVASEAGLNDDEALGVGQDAADTVRTGTPTTRSSTAAMERTRARQQAILRDAALAEATAAATARAVSDELVNQRLIELGLDPNQFDDQHTIRQKLREQEEARMKLEPARIQSRNARILDSNCQCIRIKDNGEYGCLDGFVVGNNSSGKPLCDIYRGN